MLYLRFGVYVLFCFCLLSHAEQKITIAFETRKETTTSLSVTKYVNVRFLSKGDAPNLHIDLLAHTSWRDFSTLFKSQKWDIPFYLRENDRAVQFFEDKGAWAEWMKTVVGLGDYVPKTFLPEDRLSIRFPLLFKLPQDVVKLVRNKGQFTRQVKKAIASHTPYTLVEALIGMELTKVMIYGSVYKGQLLSMRCLKRYYLPGNRNATLLDALAFGTDTVLNAQSEHFIPCSQELVNVTTVMFAAAPAYTGAFCSSLRTNMQNEGRLMEVNARFCGSLRYNDDILAATMVPLSYAVSRDQSSSAFISTSATKNKSNKRVATKKKKWVQDAAYTRILDTEREILRTGGGIFENQFVVVSKFDHNLKVDAPSYDSVAFEKVLNQRSSPE